MPLFGVTSSPRGSTGPVEDAPFVSVIVPCRNEARFIGQCLDSILQNEYPKGKLEILVVDGMSEDGTRCVVEDYARRHAFIRLLDNPKKITPVAMNLGIRASRGDVVIRADAHARFDRKYITRCVECLGRYGADNVGGIMRTLPRKPGLTGNAIALSLSHRFGVGNSYFRVHTDEPRWVDTVFGGCYRKEVFQNVGFFNEKLARGQDMEFNRRLKKAGGKILLAPTIVSDYYARSDLSSFWKHNFQNGVWAILPFAYSNVVPVSPRHLVPLGFAIALLWSSLLGLLWKPAYWLLLAILLAYGLSNLAASLQVARRERDPRYLLAMPFLFATLHATYGVGSLWGMVRLLGIRHFWNRVLGPARMLFSDEV